MAFINYFGVAIKLIDVIYSCMDENEPKIRFSQLLLTIDISYCNYLQSTHPSNGRLHKHFTVFSIDGTEESHYLEFD